MTIPRSYRCRRPAFLEAQKRISAYYREQSTEKKYQKKLELQTSIDILKRYLYEFHELPSYGSRILRIRLAEKIFETVLQSDDLLEKNPRFRQTVYDKIDELTDDLDTYLSKKRKSIQKHILQIQDTLQLMIPTLPECGPLSVRLQDWMNDLSTIEETDRHDYLRSLFHQIKVRYGSTH